MTEKEKFEALYKFETKGGCIVKTSLGEGKTKNSDNSYNGKIKVYLNNGTNLLSSPSNIEIIGFYD